MSARELDPHARAERLLAERHAGMLDAGAGAWLDEHLSGCAHCRALAAELEERAHEADDGGAHLPVGLVSRWPTESQRLPALVREHAVEHLRSCDACRREFELCGHALPEGVLREARVPVAEPERRGLFGWLFGTAAGRWVSGGALAGAAAALLFALRVLQPNVQMAQHTPPPTPVPAPPRETPGDTTRSAPPPPVVAEPSLALAGGGDAGLDDLPELALGEVTVRGGEAETTSTAPHVLPKGATALRLLHPQEVMLIEDPATRVAVEITSPSGRTLRTNTEARSLRTTRPLLLRMPQGLEAGAYGYVYRYRDGGRDVSIRGELRVRF